MSLPGDGVREKWPSWIGNGGAVPDESRTLTKKRVIEGRQGHAKSSAGGLRILDRGAMVDRGSWADFRHQMHSELWTVSARRWWQQDPETRSLSPGGGN